jgi:hypothetical protein
MTNSTYTRCRKTVSTVMNSQAKIPSASGRRVETVGAQHRLIELADTRTPRRSNSPWMRW